MVNNESQTLVKTFSYTGFALLAFAANSVLCRMALGEKTIDAPSFTVVRLLVPVIAAVGGILFVSEMVTIRFIFSAMMILGGILLVVLGQYYFVQRKPLR